MFDSDFLTWIEMALEQSVQHLSPWAPAGMTHEQKAVVIYLQD